MARPRKPRLQRNPPTRKGKTNPAAAPRDDGILRGDAGRFAPGTIAGPGNPNAKQMAAARAAAVGAVSPETMAGIFKTHAEIALAGGRGSVESAKFVSSYVLGKPEQVVKFLTENEATQRSALETLVSIWRDRGLPQHLWPPAVQVAAARLDAEAKQAHARAAAAAGK